MAAPVIAWLQCGGSLAGVTYTTILSLDFGTVTAGKYSAWKTIRPKVTINSVQSCKWWLNDSGAVNAGTLASVGAAAGWYHGYTFNASAPRCLVTAVDATAAQNGVVAVETSAGAGASYGAVSLNAYGDFIGLCLKVASAAVDGATTAWGYQLKYSYT